MAFTTLSLGLTLTIPTNGSVNWGTTLLNTTWTKISNHRHQGSGDGQQIPTAGLVDNSITTAKLSKNYGYTQASTVTPAGTTQTLNFNDGNVQQLDLSSATGNVTLTLSNPATGSIYYIWVTQGATFRDLVWPAAVKWPQAQAPILSSGAGKVDLVKLYYTGSIYRGEWELDFS
jgi:hypothetical protein